KFIDSMAALNEIKKSSTLKFPMIVKPNFEGSSMGITMDSVVENFDALKKQVETQLPKYPNGLIVEEYIKGFDLTVPFLEKAAPESGGILEPASYEFHSESNAKRKYDIYDFEMKSINYNSVSVNVPAPISTEQKKEVIELSKKIVKTLNIRDMGRIDFRVADDRKIYFIEVNALPSLEPGASIYISSAHAGLDSLEKVLGSIVQSAIDRFGLKKNSNKLNGKKTPIKVGLTYNLRRVKLIENSDQDAEFDAPETIEAIRRAIESFGHEVVELEATTELPSILPTSSVDVVFNIAEGIEGRTRESQVPALLELLGIPYTGSDATTLSIALDKGIAKRLVTEAGLFTPPFIQMMSGKERLPKNLTFPVIVKPIAEGSSKGIVMTSVVETEAELRKMVQEIAAKYRQAIIAESFLPGREFTVALLGEKRPRALPPMEVVFTDLEQKHPTYSFETKFFSKQIKYEVPAKIEEPLRRELERVSKNIFTILGCRDLARVDLRLDQDGKVNFMECNPLPGLTPGFSDLCIIAEASGLNYRALIGEILNPAIRRMKEKNKEKYQNGKS
ncbi:MAG: ATP-grasp domain-containing protein, partial [Pseudomonadota bacterium]